ncbi:MAG: hypothetical protein U0168_05500 [Nannocystaceae bacterium]
MLPLTGTPSMKIATCCGALPRIDTAPNWPSPPSWRTWTPGARESTSTRPSRGVAVLGSSSASTDTNPGERAAAPRRGGARTTVR